MTVAVYGPDKEAFAEMEPEISPAVSIDRPGGNPVAEKVNVPDSGSEKCPAILSDTTSPSSLVCVGIADATTGTSLVPVILIVNVAVADPPAPSEMV
ncbi:hypothetical protein Pla52n_69520 [Stieleria varia]|uniref:Uncharacterized protein n=1 Tax=Stieleria varia TaxID=2528005 RepID=A0A5C5ZM54_9BACT|nr:hypothetical protein Pla52n_69520 [Stieleria varia]